MRIEQNAGGGDTVVVEPGDELTQVPKSHRELVSPVIREAFADPIAYFRRIAEECRHRQMSRWLISLVSNPNWELELNRGCPYDERVNWTMPGFRWNSDSVTGAVIGLPSDEKPEAIPAPLAEYYSMVDFVHWSIFGGAGGLEGAREHTPLTTFPHYCQSADIDPKSVFVWGSSGCGDMLIYTRGDRAGWLCHENGHIHWLGSIEDAISWIFGELLAGKEPDYDYNWP